MPEAAAQGFGDCCGELGRRWWLLVSFLLRVLRLLLRGEDFELAWDMVR
jgi:hypothetical protein